MNTENITANETYHFHEFIKNFAPSKSLKDRWLYFLEKKSSSHWAAVEPWKFWGMKSNNYKADILDRITCENFREHKVIKNNISQIHDIVIVACGNSTPEIKTLDIGTFLEKFPIEMPLEYVASLIPGKLSLVTNHDGMSLLLSKL